METSSISIIKKTENDAQKIVDDARVKAENMIAETENSSKDFLQKTIDDTSLENEKRINDILAKSNVIVENNKALQQKEADEYEEKARLRLMGAVKIILKEITEQCQ